MQKFINIKSFQTCVSRVSNSHARTEESSPVWASPPTYPVRWVQEQIIPKRKQYMKIFGMRRVKHWVILQLIWALTVVHNQNS